MVASGTMLSFLLQSKQEPSGMSIKLTPLWKQWPRQLICKIREREHLSMNPKLSHTKIQCSVFSLKLLTPDRYKRSHNLPAALYNMLTLCSSSCESHSKSSTTQLLLVTAFLLVVLTLLSLSDLMNSCPFINSRYFSEIRASYRTGDELHRKPKTNAVIKDSLSLMVITRNAYVTTWTLWIEN